MIQEAQAFSWGASTPTSQGLTVVQLVVKSLAAAPTQHIAVPVRHQTNPSCICSSQAYQGMLLQHAQTPQTPGALDPAPYHLYKQPPAATSGAAGVIST